MPRTTEHFNLVYAADNEVLYPSTEEDRFITIDRQLFGMFEVLGNGVISGWDVTAGDGLSIVKSSGSGIIDYNFVETETVTNIYELNPNAEYFV